jgi:regulatory protein
MEPTEETGWRVAASDVSQGRDRDPVQQARQWLAEQGVEVTDDLDEIDERTVGGRHLYGSGRPEAHSSGGVDASSPGGRSAASAAAHAPAPAVEVEGSHSRSRGPSAGERRPPEARAEDLADRDRGPDADPEAVARAIVLRKLAAQARTRAELSKALESKQVPAGAAAAVLDRMEAVGLVDDEEFARDWVESRQQRRHLSRAALRRELTAKGVDRDQIDVALEQVDADDELEAARSLAAKKARSMAALDSQVRYRRLAAMLGRRGFSSGVIARVTAEALRHPAS